MTHWEFCQLSHHHSKVITYVSIRTLSLFSSYSWCDWLEHIHCTLQQVLQIMLLICSTSLFSCLQSPSHSLWILGHRCTFQSHCHSQPHFGSCRFVGKLPRRIQESMSHYSRAPTSPACRHTLQTWGDSWETWIKETSHSGVNMTPKAHANVALAMITKWCVGNSMHTNWNFLPRLGVM